MLGVSPIEFVLNNQESIKAYFERSEELRESIKKNKINKEDEAIYGRIFWAKIDKESDPADI